MLIFLLYFLSIIICQEYIYSPSDIIDYINGKIEYSEEDYKLFIKLLSNSFSDVYAFNDLSKNPPQPDFNSNYHEKVDIQKELNEIDLNEITPYEFYRKIWQILSKLKDQHIQIKWKALNLDKFLILGPLDFSMKEDEDGNIKIYGECIEDNQLEDFYNGNQISEICQYYSDTPIKSINDMDPFEYINNFGGNFLSTKNIHGTFSFKIKYHNNVPLSDYPLSLEDFQNYKVEFESGESFTTEYLIISDIDIDNENLRNLDENKNIIHKKKIFKENSKLINQKRARTKTRGKSIEKNKLLLMNGYLRWNYEYEDILKCVADETNQVNIYYITSFEPSNKNNFNKTIENCYTLFDNNSYPIIVINDLNNGGYISFSQLFLGIISPLIPINLYSGRMRITESFNNSKEINEFITSNLTKIKDCQNCTYNNLIEGKININYGDDIKSELTELFYINNMSIYNDIEYARNKMNHKRKPTEILIYTDGYSFSAASLYLKYLKENGGGIIVQYLGNPKKSDEKFDISQSPSPVFTSKIIELFSTENYKKLLEENECELQMPGIQSFYNSTDSKTPLEYEYSSPDEKSDIYENFDENSYEKFVNKAKIIFEKYKEECNYDNKYLLKITEECEGKFDNNYTHGGYECGSDGKWKNTCVPSYCDLGYTFDKINKKCIKDICSFLDLPIIDVDEEEEENGIEEEIEIEEENEEEEDKKEEENNYRRKKEKHSNLVFYIALPITLVLYLSVLIYIIYYRLVVFQK